MAGDIFAVGRITGLTVQGPAVVSTGSNIPPSITRIGDVWVVTGYSPRLRDTWHRIMQDNLARLRAERAVRRTTLPSDFDGTPDRLGGGVWYSDQSLTVPTVGVSGRGTLMVDSGDIIIGGNIDATVPIGLVARSGNIVIRGSVGSLRNVSLYAPTGSIIIEPGVPLTVRGALIARSFSLAPRDLTVIYSSQVALQPPPGFISFILPTVLERAP